MTFLLDDDSAAMIADEPQAQIRRASHVVPQNPLLRLAFVTLRFVFGEKGRISDHTRRWSCRWMADLAPSDGPVLGPFVNRHEAIDAEVSWLNEHVLSEGSHEVVYG